MSTPKIKRSFLVTIALTFCVYLSFADDNKKLTVKDVKLVQYHLDTVNNQYCLHPIQYIKASVKASPAVIKKSNQQTFILDKQTDFDSSGILILINGRKKKDLKNINPELIKSIKVLKNEDMPKRYRKKGITGVIKVKTKKRHFTGKGSGSGKKE